MAPRDTQHAYRPRSSPRENSEHMRLTFYQQLLREIIQSMDDAARPTYDVLTRDVTAYFRERGYAVTRPELEIVMDRTVLRLTDALCNHARGLREMGALDLKISQVLYMVVYVIEDGVGRPQPIDVFTPIADRPINNAQYSINFMRFTPRTLTRVPMDQ